MCVCWLFVSHVELRPAASVLTLQPRPPAVCHLPARPPVPDEPGNRSPFQGSWALSQGGTPARSPCPVTLGIYKTTLMSGGRVAGQDLAGPRASGAMKPADSRRRTEQPRVPGGRLCAPCGPHLKGPAPVSRTTSPTEKGPLRLWASSHGAGVRAGDAGAVHAVPPRPEPGARPRHPSSGVYLACRGGPSPRPPDVR